MNSVNSHEQKTQNSIKRKDLLEFYKGKTTNKFNIKDFKATDEKEKQGSKNFAKELVTSNGLANVAGKNRKVTEKTRKHSDGKDKAAIPPNNTKIKKRFSGRNR